MDKQYLDLLDSALATVVLALAITMRCSDPKKKEIADRYILDLQNEVMRTRKALCEVLRLQQNEVHNDNRYS